MSLTPRQRQFVDRYVHHGNAQVAAVEAGYSKNRARQAAHALLSNDKVQAEIDRRQMKPSLAAVVKSSKDVTPEYVTGVILHCLEETEKAQNWSAVAKFVDMLAKSKGMYTEKVEVDITSSIMERLLAGRQRARLVQAEEVPALPEGEDGNSGN